MSDALRWLLLGLVLLNLAFVQLTDAVSAGWMTALWTLTATAPLLVRLQDGVAYRAVWNVLVLAAFAWLLRHAMTTGLLHMLEDGLLLSALCQVHLLNNVGRRQRPDLLFFNSFLITFVTSFFSHDLGWSLCFCLYAALLVPALQLFVVLPRDGSAAPGTVRALLRDSVPRTACVVACTALVFVSWPRDFHHEGWLGDTLQFSAPALVAFAEEIRLDRNTTPQLDDRPVLRVRPVSGGSEGVPSHWRGVTFVRFDGSGWQQYRARDFATRRATDVLWQAVSRTAWQRPAVPREPRLVVQLLDLSANRLFLPLEASLVQLREADAAVLLDPKADGVLALDPFTRPEDDLECEIAVGRLLAADATDLSARARDLLCQLPEPVPLHLDSLRREVRSGLPDSPTPNDVAAHFSSWLSDHRRYALPGAQGAARNLGEFLLGSGGGHCEYFATTLALLLRMEEIPCRVVGGYMAHEWNDERGEMLVRQRDAHAWVEALLPGTGWTTLDGTPPSSLARESSDPSWLAGVWQELEAAWQRVTGFDEEGRSNLMAWLRAMPGRVAASMAAHPLLTSGLCGALLAGLWWRRRRHVGRQVPTITGLERAMRRARVTARPGETPREMLARARTEGLEPAAEPPLAAAVRAHEAARYGR